MKLYIISVSNSAYTSTGLIIPPSFKNTGQSFKSHYNTQAKSRHIAFRAMCFLNRKILAHSELKQDKKNIAVK